MRRGTIEIPTAKGFKKLQPRAVSLGPAHPFLVADHVVPRSGIQVDHYFVLTRSSDSVTLLWLVRKSDSGQGSGWSGKRLDMVRDIKNDAK